MKPRKFGRMKRDPLARALRNSPPYRCPDLDAEVSESDQERAGMPIDERWLPSARVVSGAIGGNT